MKKERKEGDPVKETQTLCVTQGSERINTVDFGTKNGTHFMHCLVGHTLCKPNYYCMFYAPKHYCFMYFVKGKGSLRLADRNYTPKAGELYLYRPDEEWEYKTDPCDPWELYWINISGNFGLSLLSLYRLTESMRLDFPAAEAPLRHIFNLSSPTARIENNTQDIVLREVIKFVQEIAQAANTHNETKQMRDLRIMCNYIHNHITESIRISDVCAPVFRSTSGAGLLFRKAYGCSIKEYILKEKFEVASSLLSGTRLPISQIASDLSFCDAQHFSQMFTQRFGMSPLRYRQSLQAEKE